jgi:hypothetical protein
MSVRFVCDSCGAWKDVQIANLEQLGVETFVVAKMIPGWENVQIKGGNIGYLCQRCSKTTPTATESTAADVPGLADALKEFKKKGKKKDGRKNSMRRVQG